MSTTLDRYVGRVSIAGIDRHSTAGVFSTHDPVFLQNQFTCFLWWAIWNGGWGYICLLTSIEVDEVFCTFEI